MYPLGSRQAGRKADQIILEELKKLFQDYDVRAFGLAVVGRIFQLYGTSWKIVGVDGRLAPDLTILVVVDDENQQRWADEVQRRTGVNWSQVGSESADWDATKQVLGIDIPSNLLGKKVVQGCDPTKPWVEVLLVTEEYLRTPQQGYGESMREACSEATSLSRLRVPML